MRWASSPPPNPLACSCRQPGDAQRLGACSWRRRERELATEHDEDWFRNPRAIEQLRAETRVAPAPLHDRKLGSRARSLKQALIAAL